MQTKFIIGGGWLVTLGSGCQVIENGAVLVEGREIKAVGATADLRQAHPAAEFIDVQGRLITPGLVNAHHHLYSTFACGIACEPSANFVEILRNLWWRLDKALQLEDVYLSAVIPLVRCLRAGVTTIIDHHASPSAIEGSLNTIAKATEEVGIRACLCYEVTDRGGEKQMRAGIEENVAFIKACRAGTNRMLAGLFGLHASFTLSDQSLTQCVQAVEGLETGFHVHVAEDRADQEDCEQKYGKRVVERFQDMGILGPRSLAIHGIHLTPHEVELLLASDTTVVHNPQSNQNNAVGAAQVLTMIKQGVRVGLGTDGMTSNMLEEMRVCNWFHHHVQGDPRVAFGEACDMLLQTNPVIASRFFDKPVGVIQPGAWADIVVFDYWPYTPLSVENLYGHFMFGLLPAPVHTVFVDGQVRYQNGKVLGLDECEIYTRARERAAQVWQRF